MSRSLAAAGWTLMRKTPLRRLRRRASLRYLQSMAVSLRAKFFIACLLMAITTGLLGTYAQWTQREIGAFATRTYDETFVAMTYLRSAQNGLLKLRAALEREALRVRDRPTVMRAPSESLVLAGALPDILAHLQVARERGVSAMAKASSDQLRDQLLALRGILRERGTPAMFQALDALQVAFDGAVEIHASDAFRDRREVDRLTEASSRQTLVAIGVSAFAAILISYLLARAVLPRIRTAVSAARAISSGRLDTAIETRGRDEVAVLLRALARMQASLAEKIGHINQLAAAATDQAKQLQLQNGRFEGALDNMIQGLSMFDANGRLVVYNRRFEAMFGPPVQGARPGSFAVSGVPAVQVAPGTHNLEMPDGRIIAISHQPMTDGGWVDTFEDVTERIHAEANLERMARYDGLTKLPNRAFFRERLEEALDKARECGPVVLCLDLDGFKTVNDTLGHMVGDGLLRAVAQRLRDCVRTSDVVGRLGGDEFAIIQTEAGSPGESEGLAKRIIESLGTVFEIEHFQVAIGVSIGIAREDRPSDDALAERATALLKNADVALYRAKVEGRATFRFFAAEMDRKLQARRLLELDLRTALEKGQFELFFQPLVNAGRGGVCCFEALLRWNHPERGMVPPDEFIPVAEETGLIKAIGRWVLQRACTEAAVWPCDVSVAVNMSPVQFGNPFLAAEVVKALDVSGLDPRRLELEITESVLILEDALVLTTLHQIRDLGVRIALDDFGTGYSSLSYLRRFPFDKIKIDRSFVRDLAAEDNIAIVRAIMGLGHALKMCVVAEGVETLEQQIVLVGEGCTELQGYYFSPPRSAGHVPGLIDRLRTALPHCA